MTRGLVLGKFMPPHRGHQFLCDFARSYADDLTIVVGTLEDEPIPGELRHGWMRELYPDCEVVHLTDDNPQYPEEHPEFWDIWKASLERVMSEPPDYVFASEPYGRRLADVLGAEFVPCERATLPISGGEIRADPMAHWGYIARCARPYFARRVCVFGPESTGKTTLARALAERFATAYVPEYARILLESQDGHLADDDLEKIVRGQIAVEQARALDANRVLICDTDVLTTSIWYEFLHHRSPPWLHAQIDRHDYDLYLLCGTDVPYHDEPVRYLPDRREEFYRRCKDELDRRGRRYLQLSGDHEHRLGVASAVIEQLLRSRPDEEPAETE